MVPILSDWTPKILLRRHVYGDQYCRVRVIEKKVVNKSDIDYKNFIMSTISNIPNPNTKTDTNFFNMKV